MNINLTLIAQAVSFFIFIWFTARFVWPPLLKAIEKRQKEIADGLAAAERGKQDLELASKRADGMEAARIGRVCHKATQIGCKASTGTAV